MIESEQSDKKSLGIAEWNLLISKHERDNSWFCYKNKIWGMHMFTVDVFEKLNKLNMTLQKKKIVWTWNVEVFKTKVSLFAKQASEGNFCHFFFIRKTKSAC